MQNIISVESLANLDSIRYRILDCRFSLMDPEYGKKAFLEGHIPGAVYANLNEDLSGEIISGVTGRHPLPSKSEFEATLSSWGIEEDQMLILYDDDIGSYAARAWWMFRWLGHSKVKVLNGGYKAWRNAGHETTQENFSFEESTFTQKQSLTKDINADSLQSFTGTICDARDPKRFIGEHEPIDPVAGHIPGASCLPFPKNMSPDGLFKSASELRALFLEHGISDKEACVCYCGSGVTAAHNILCLVEAGFPEPILYPGSWSEWITDPTREIALGN